MEKLKGMIEPSFATTRVTAPDNTYESGAISPEDTEAEGMILLRAARATNTDGMSLATS